VELCSTRDERGERSGNSGEREPHGTQFCRKSGSAQSRSHCPARKSPFFARRGSEMEHGLEDEESQRAFGRLVREQAGS
jgi:hypothetical protein